MEQKHILFTTTVGEKETMEMVGKHCKEPHLWQEYRDLYRKSIQCNPSDIPTYPIQLEFELNGTCNYKCESCTYRLDRHTGKRPEIPFEKFCEIVDDGVSKGLKAIRFNYHNEPLMKKDIFQYIKYAKNVGIVDTYFSTNGSLLDESTSRQLIGSGLDRLQVSIDANTHETYEKLRPGGNFDKVRENVLKFMELRNQEGRELPAVRVNFVKQPENVNELQTFCEYWQEKGVDSIGIQDYSDWMREKEDSEYEDVKFQCNMPFNRLVIRYDGSVLPCCLFVSEKLKLGSIYENTIEELWRCDVIAHLRLLHSDEKGWMQNSVCNRCVKSLR